MRPRIRRTTPGLRTRRIAINRSAPQAKKSGNVDPVGGAAAEVASAKPRSGQTPDRKAPAKTALLGKKATPRDAKIARASAAIANEVQGAASDVPRPRHASNESTRMKRPTKTILIPTISWTSARTTIKPVS
jgi:hypothetical protein